MDADFDRWRQTIEVNLFGVWEPAHVTDVRTLVPR